MNCWDAHLGLVRHRESWAEEKKAPTKEFWDKVLAGTELFPPRVAKVKEEEAPKPVSSAVKTVIRRTPKT